MTAPDLPVPAPSVGPTDKPTMEIEYAVRCPSGAIRALDQYWRPFTKTAAQTWVKQENRGRDRCCGNSPHVVVQRAVYSSWQPLGAPVGGGQRDNTE